MRTLPRVALCLLLATGMAHAQGAVDPYDVIEQALRPYVAADDPFGLPMKLRAATTDRYKFWRGSKDLFFAWSKEACRDWYADPTSFAFCHGDVHFGNVGVIPGPGGALAFGLVDFDDSGNMPFQLDLLEAAITLELCIPADKAKNAGQKHTARLSDLLAAYSSALQSDAPAIEMMRDRPAVADLIEKAKGADDSNVLKAFVRAEKFELTSERQRGREILRPATSAPGTLAKALLEAASRDPSIAHCIGPEADLPARILDSVQRTRIDSAGSQGLSKLLILIRQPGGQLAILYLKQVIPSAAERQGAIPAQTTPPGRRLVEQAAKMSGGAPAAWCELEGRSYIVSILESRSRELDARKLDSNKKLDDGAAILGAVLGCAHRPWRQQIVPHLKTLTAAMLAEKSGQYVRLNQQWLDELSANPRAKAAIQSAQHAIDSR